MGFKIIRKEQETEEPVTQVAEEQQLAQAATSEPDTPFKKALIAEKDNLTRRIGELEGELQGAKDQIKAGTEKKESIAKEAEDIARRMKAIDTMVKIY